MVTVRVVVADREALPADAVLLKADGDSLSVVNDRAAGGVEVEITTAARVAKRFWGALVPLDVPVVEAEARLAVGK